MRLRVMLLIVGGVGFALGLTVFSASSGRAGDDGRLAQSALLYVAYAAAFFLSGWLTLRGRRLPAAIIAGSLLVIPIVTFFFGILALIPGFFFLLAALLPGEESSEARHLPKGA